VHQAVKVNSKLGTNFKDPLQKGDIGRVEDGKTLKKALVMVEVVLKKRNVKTSIQYYRYKVCSKYGHVEKPFARNQLLYDEHLTAAVLGIVSKEGFLKKKDKLALIIVCSCKKANCATAVHCEYRKNGKLCTSKCHGGIGVNTLCTL